MQTMISYYNTISAKQILKELKALIELKFKLVSDYQKKRISTLINRIRFDFAQCG